MTSRTQGSPVEGSFSVGGDLGGSADYYTWLVGDSEPGAGWRLRAEGVIGTYLTINLLAEDGTVLSAASSGLDATVELTDLQLAPGRYGMWISASGEVYPYRLQSTLADLSGDPEPNDIPARARPDRHRDAGPRPAGQGRRSRPLPAHGRRRLGGHVAGRQADRRAGHRPQPVPAGCRRDERRSARMTNGPTSLPNLLLPPATTCSISRASATPRGSRGYALRVDVTTAPARDFETEPNATPDSATRVRPHARDAWPRRLGRPGHLPPRRDRAGPAVGAAGERFGDPEHWPGRDRTSRSWAAARSRSIGTTCAAYGPVPRSRRALVPRRCGRGVPAQRHAPGSARSKRRARAQQRRGVRGALPARSGAGGGPAADRARHRRVPDLARRHRTARADGHAAGRRRRSRSTSGRKDAWSRLCGHPAPDSRPPRSYC